MLGRMKSHLTEELKQISDGGLYKAERIITSPQDAMITIQTGQKVLNLCANNYLGLADHPDVVRAARDSFAKWGYGLSSVRFICGTQQVHKELEKKISEFLGTEDTILYSCCFDANTGLFETLLTAEDAIISDQLNHASIIDGIRLCKAQRLRFKNSDMQDLEENAGSGRKTSASPIGTISHDCNRRRVLDGWNDSEAGSDMRTCRKIRCAGHGGRLARDRRAGQTRPRSYRALRRNGTRRYYHGNAR